MKIMMGGDTTAAATACHHNHGGPVGAPATAGHDLGPKKTMVVVVIVIGCFAVLWPKVLYPMMVGNANDYIKPSAIDKTTGCCDVFSERDVNTIRVMAELCRTILPPELDFDGIGPRPARLAPAPAPAPLSTSRQSQLTADTAVVQRCRHEIFTTCGIDLAAVLPQGRPSPTLRLDHASLRQILNEARSLNGSLCLKYNFGVSPGRLNVPHRVLIGAKDANIRQERPPLLRPEILHPAFRERGAAIPRTAIPLHQSPPQQQHPNRPPLPPSATPPRIIDGRPGPIPGMRPPMGGAGGVVPPPTKGTSSMSFIMPVYTIAIVIFFTYNLLKILFKKQPQGPGGVLYPPVDPDHSFRRDVFGPAQQSQGYLIGQRQNKEAQSSRLGWKERDAIVNAMSQLLDEVDGEIEARKKAKNSNGTVHAPQKADTGESGIKSNGTVANGTIGTSKIETAVEDVEQTSVKVLGMETTASCEGGQKWSRPNTPIPPPVATIPVLPKEPPQEIYLEGCLPAQSKLLVADSKVEATSIDIEKDAAVVLSGKMTLSVISVDQLHEDNDDEMDQIEDSKYTTASGATAAEPDASDHGDLTDEENGDDLLDDCVNEKINEE